MFCVENCIDRFTQTYSKIESSGLLDKTNNIHVVMVGDNSNNYESQLKNLNKVTTYHYPNLFGEMNTINFVYNFCQTNSDNYVLYLHSKGASKNGNPNVKAWVDYMEYFLIENYSLCLESLKTFDTVGVDYLPAPMPHYSGNFWWANSKYIKTHDSFNDGLSHSIITDPRWYCEFWLLHNSKSNHKCLHNSSTDLYGNLYTKDKYEIK